MIKHVKTEYKRSQQAVENFILILFCKIVGNCGELCNFGTDIILRLKVCVSLAT